MRSHTGRNRLTKMREKTHEFSNCQALAGKRAKRGGFSRWCAVIWRRFRGDRDEKWAKQYSNDGGCDEKACYRSRYNAGSKRR